MKFYFNSFTLALLSSTAIHAIPTPGFGSTYKSVVGILKKPSYGSRAAAPVEHASAAPLAAAAPVAAAVPVAAAAPVEQIRAANPNAVKQAVRNAPAGTVPKNALVNARSESSQSLSSVDSLDSTGLFAEYEKMWT
jgi:hypothetical protein